MEKRVVKFKDKEGNLAKIDIEIKEGRFSMSGQISGSCGQCQGDIKPKNKAQKALLDIWDKWHLNDMHAGTEKQEAIIEKFKNNAQFKSFDKFLDKPCAILESQGLLIDNGYKYGSAWLMRGLPTDLWVEVKKLCALIEAIEEEEKEALPSAEWQDIEDDCIIALAQHLGLTPAEAIEDISGEGNIYGYCGTDYYIGTDEELTDIALAYLTDESELWKQAVEAGSTEKSLQEWAEWVIDMDGIGHTLNSWDGSENSETVNNVGYTICRR